MTQNQSLANKQSLSDSMRLEQKQLWQFFSEIEDTPTFYITWLSRLRAKIPGVEAAVLLLTSPEDGAFAPVAIWPDPKRDISYLSDAAQSVLSQRQAIIYRAPEDTANINDSVQICCPVQKESRTGGDNQDAMIQGVVVLDVMPRPQEELQSILEQIQWDLGWLQSRLWQEQARQNSLFSQRASMALDILAVAEEHTLIEPACMAVANEVAIKLNCDRVSVGLIKKRQKKGASIRLRAMSHSAWFRKKTSLVDELENAMEEALDQGATVVYPHQPYASKRIFVAHKEYAENWKVRHIISFVLMDKSIPVGVLTIERRGKEAFDEEALKSGESIAALIAPVLDLKRRERRWVSGRISDAIRGWTRKIFGSRYPAIKLLVSILTLLVVFLIFYPTQFRISGDAVLEGVLQQASVAPFDGFIESSKVRAGDIAEKNQLLATLDDKDLKIEVLKWESERSKLIQEQREAFAIKDRTEIALLDAQIKQSEAQLSLAQLKLARTQIHSPIEGLVISGDLSQKLGAPVQKGETLFEIAPLREYRVVLKIDERDIRYIKTGYKGTLLLSGMAGKAIPLTIVNITAVSEADEGLNIFRVEASLDETLLTVRPGMEGVGKINIDERSLGWIWTRAFVDWFRMFTWRWIP